MPYCARSIYANIKWGVPPTGEGKLCFERVSGMKGSKMCWRMPKTGEGGRKAAEGLPAGDVML
jgi:hypothetical protein